MAKYELMLILNPSISEEDRKTSLENIKSLVVAAQGKVEEETVWWDKKLAYKIHSSQIGYYVIYQLEIDGKELFSITSKINLDLNVWRHMFVRNED